PRRSARGWPRRPMLTLPLYGIRLRGVWQAAVVRHVDQPLAPSYSASLEPERPEGAGDGERRAAADPRVHLVHQGRQDPEAAGLVSSQRVRREPAPPSG